MRAYAITVYTYDNIEHIIEWNYDSFCEKVSDKDAKFIMFESVKWIEYCLNVSNIKSITKTSLIQRNIRPDWEEKIYISRWWTWEKIEIDKTTLTSYEK